VLAWTLALVLLTPARAEGDPLPTDEPQRASPAPKRIEGLAPEVAQPEKTIKEKWEDLYRAIGEAKQKDYSVFPVMIFSMEGQAKLPAHIFICKNEIYKRIVEGVLEAVLPPNWRKTGDYWITSKKLALAEFSKSLGIQKDKNKVKDLEKTMDADFSGAEILIYQYHRVGPPQDDEDEGDQAAPAAEEEREPMIMVPMAEPAPPPSK
jgi:hypothetical protein